MASKIFREARKKIPNHSRVFVKNSFDIIERITEILENKGISQKELAKRLNKSESEVSKILSPGHNLTLKTLSKIEAAMGDKIIHTQQHLKITFKVSYEKPATQIKYVKPKKQPIDRHQYKKQAYC